jgi:hypothetical protein
MTEKSTDDTHARHRLAILGVPPAHVVTNDPRWSETLNVPISKPTLENLEWLAATAGGEPNTLAANILAQALIKADNQVSDAFQRAKVPASPAPSYYGPLVGALRHGYQETKLIAALSSLELKDWQQIVADAASPSNNALDVLAEFAGFADRSEFVVHLIKLSSLSPEELSTIRERINEHRRALQSLEAIEQALR